MTPKEDKLYRRLLDCFVSGLISEDFYEATVRYIETFHDEFKNSRMQLSDGHFRTEIYIPGGHWIQFLKDTENIIADHFTFKDQKHRLYNKHTKRWMFAR